MDGNYNKDEWMIRYKTVIYLFNKVKWGTLTAESELETTQELCTIIGRITI